MSPKHAEQDQPLIARASLFGPLRVSSLWSVSPPSQHRFTARADRDSLRRYAASNWAGSSDHRSARAQASGSVTTSRGGDGEEQAIQGTTAAARTTRTRVLAIGPEPPARRRLPEERGITEASFLFAHHRRATPIFDHGVRPAKCDREFRTWRYPPSDFLI